MNVTSRVKHLLVGTALTVPLAFGATTAFAQDENACAELERLLEGDLPERVAQTEDELRQIIANNDLEQCQVLSLDLRAAQGETSDTATTESDAATAEASDSAQVVEQEQARIKLEDEVVIQGEVLVDQQPPRVDIESGDTEVNVTNAMPDVTVREQQAEILVRQAAPTIRVEMPQPTITIEQAAPEIIITMPPPGVDVTAARPQVEVRQAEPRVSVSQNPPQIDLQLSRAPDPDSSEGIAIRNRATGEELASGQAVEMPEAEVNMTRAEPIVTYQESEGQQANVQVERAQPTVRYESAEPQVEFSQSGEPQVQFTQSGEPQVTFQEAGGEQEQPAPEGQPPAPEEAQADTEQQPVMDAQAPQEQPAEASDMQVEADAPEAVQLEDTEIETTEGADVAAAPVAEPEAEADTGLMVMGEGPQIEREGYRMTQVNEIDVTQLTGTPVYGVNDEDVGDIGDLIMNADGQVQDAVIDVGGFLGLGEKPVLVPFSQLTLMQSDAGDDLRAYIGMTEDELEAMEAYDQ